VQRAIYLLFNEGYHGANDASAVREDLCLEALRLGSLVAADPRLSTPSACALLALMCLHGARLPARVDDDRWLITLAHQDRSRWDQDLLAQGLHWLAQSAVGDEATEYHLEAAIAGHHAVAPSLRATNWEEIRRLYDALYHLQPTPIIALNRAIALGMAEGPRAGAEALEQIPHQDRLDRYPFHAAALGDVYLRLGDPERARRHFAEAAALARNPSERQLLESKLRAVRSP
jgi:RNA polymerase sigma-70 factor (ECF subfamily)